MKKPNHTSDPRPLYVGVVLIAILLTILLIASPEKKNQESVISDFNEGTHYTVVDVPENIRAGLKQLGYDTKGTFELFSYSCIHCYSFENFITSYELASSSNVTKIQLGFEGFPIAETHYMMDKHFNDSELKESKTAMYETMTSPDISWEKKEVFVNAFVNAKGIPASEIEAMTPAAKRFAKLSRDLMIAVDLKSTPALYLHGKYLVHMQEIGSLDNLLALDEYLSELPK